MLNKLSDHCHERLWGRKPDLMLEHTKREIQDRLAEFALDKAEDENPVVELPLPDWMPTAQECVDLAVAQYRDPLVRLFRLLEVPIAPLPTKYNYLPGWQCWDGSKWVKCPAPSGLDMVLDVETNPLDTSGLWHPITCVAWTSQGWLRWLTDFDPATRLIPFGKNCVVVGHNIPYDRQYLESEYYLEDSGNRFFDTISAWIAVRGMCNQNRAMYLANQKEDSWVLPWAEETGKNGLDDVYQFYTGHVLDKGVRDLIFNKGEGNPVWVRENLGTVLEYNFKDITATFKVAQHVFPELRNRQPSEASWLGQMFLGSVWLPLSSDRFPLFYNRAESACTVALGQIAEALKTEVYRVRESFVEPFQRAFVKTFPRAKDRKDSKAIQNWLETALHELSVPIGLAQSLDWTPGLSGKTSGLPLWFRKLRTDDLKLGSKVSTVLLATCYNSKPVYWFGDHTTGGWYTEDGALPHPEKKGKRVTQIFVKGWADAIQNDVITTNADRETLALIYSTINWICLRKRVADIHTENLEGFPVVLPQITVTGTVTRRAADKLWQVVANPKSDRIGTELKTMIEAPEGYSIVGADVDSEELWLFASLGDAKYGYCGSTALGFMVNAGNSEKGTDVHTVTSKSINLPRSLTKNLVYGGVYGLGLAGALNYLNKSSKNSQAENEAIAQDFLDKFKGVRQKRVGKPFYTMGLASEAFNALPEIADDRLPRTPVLKACLSASLAGVRDFATTRNNWVVQSSGVDFRDLMILLTRWFFDRLGVRGRLLMTIHDEIRLLVKSGHETQAAYALQLMHVCIRAIFLDAFGLDCIPAGVAWFSGVEIDWVMRKKYNDPCLTPSQTEPLRPGYALTSSQLKERLTSASRLG